MSTFYESCEQSLCNVQCNGKEVSIITEGIIKLTFSFDRVFDMNKSQEDIYNEVVRPYITR